MADELVGETRDIMLVGHMPNIERLLRLLIEGSAEGIASFPAHGIVALEGDRNPMGGAMADRLAPRAVGKAHRAESY